MSLKVQLCYITDRHGVAPSAFIPQLHAAVQAGVDLIQLREKDLACRDLLGLARMAVEISRGTKTRIVVNDRLDIALAAGSDGVHLGGHSVPPEVVRRYVDRSFLVGASCHSLEQGIAAEEGGADYILLGPVFGTPSKRRYGPPLGLNRLSEVANRIRIPVLALGGITVEKVKPCLKAGAAGIAAIRLFQEAPVLADRVRALRAQFD